MMLKQLENYTGDAIISNNKTYSFEQLREQISAYKVLFKDKITSHDVIILDADYSFYSISMLLAIAEYPCTVVPIVRTTDEEFELKLKSSGANKIFELRNGKLDIVETGNPQSHFEGYTDITSINNCGIVLFSSGTTGLPKVMVHDFTKLIGTFQPPRRQKNLRFLLFLMFDHIGGLNTLLGCLNNGSPIVLPTSRNPEDILDLIELNKVQILPTSPTFLNLMLLVDNFAEKDLSSLRLITYGTERMPHELLQKLNESIPNVKFLQTFGTSETGIMKTVSKSSNSLFFKIVNDDLEWKVEDGQLLIKSKQNIKGYKDVQSDQFLDDGWFATKDLVEQDEEGYIKIIGRINEIINVGGLKVMPIEVENIINQVEGVIDATVYSKPNPITGQMVCANVVMKDRVNKDELKKAIKTTCKEKLDKYKRPAKITISDTIGATFRFKKKMNQ